MPTSVSPQTAWLIGLLSMLAVLYDLSRILEAGAGLSREWASAIAAVGPWLAGWSNIGLILRLAGVVGLAFPFLRLC